MSVEIELDSKKGDYPMTIGVSIFQFYIAIFILVMGDIIGFIIMASGGAFFILMGISERMSANNWQEARLFYVIAAAIFCSLFLSIMIVMIMYLNF
jgi:heme O synthase-like polyprenyltransferase